MDELSQCFDGDRQIRWWCLSLDFLYANRADTRASERLSCAGGRPGRLTVSSTLSTPGCEHPTTTASPSGVLIANDSSFMSRVPGFSDIVVNTKKPGKISVVFRT